MAYLVTKYAVSALIVVAVSELAKRWSLAGAVLASIPTVTVLAMVWLWVETHDAERLVRFSNDVVWLVLPSLTLFAVFPLLMHSGLGFWSSLTLGLTATALVYGIGVGLMLAAGR
ncbi:MAG: DUF3147 family protein [Pseudomonadales bacterium]|nr:DUF3147 family protein [Pseudomonadales bacterium]